MKVFYNYNILRENATKENFAIKILMFQNYVKFSSKFVKSALSQIRKFKKK